MPGGKKHREWGALRSKDREENGVSSERGDKREQGVVRKGNIFCIQGGTREKGTTGSCLQVRKWPVDEKKKNHSHPCVNCVIHLRGRPIEGAPFLTKPLLPRGSSWGGEIA